MKKITTLFFLFFTLILFAQIPQGISYQGIAFDVNGNPVASGTVSLRISILQNSASGAEEYLETHSVTTNSRGLFNLNIGQGTPVNGVFSGITWRAGNKFLKVEIDPTGGTNYTSVGANQLMTVPYAMVAGELTNTSGQSLNDVIVENQETNFAFIDTWDNKAYVFDSTTGAWISQSFNPSGTPTLVSSKGNFGFIDTWDNKAYVFSAESGAWSSQSYNASGTPTFVVANGNFGFLDIWDNKAYVFDSKTGNWSSQSYNDSANPTLIGSKSNFGFIDIWDDKVYVFSSRNGNWISQSYNGSGTPTLMSGNGNFAFIDIWDDKAYVYSNNTGIWHSQAFNGSGTPSFVTSDTN